MRYIGSKLNMISEIDSFIDKNTTGKEKNFLDLFAGSNTVARHFKKNYKIITNDTLYFSYAIARGTIHNNLPLRFKGLKAMGIEDPIDYLENNNVPNKTCYYAESYSPFGEMNRMYFTSENAFRIGFIRNTIDEWKNGNLITENEYFYLLATLLESIPFISNTTGTYGAYLKKWDKRALKPMSLKPPQIINNQSNNECFNIDSNELVKNKKFDIVYIDPPYNKRQYAPNYHVLENIARNNKPLLKGVTGLFDYKNLKSSYSVKIQAEKSFTDLISNINAKHIFVSYNNEGLIEEKRLIKIMKDSSYNNHIDIKRIPYRKYKSKIPSESYELYEILLHIEKDVVNESSNNFIQESFFDTWGYEKKFIKSPLNYVGGKYKILKDIIPLFPNEIDTFIDLFSGGANVGINVKANNHVFNDNNFKLNEMFRYFQNKSPETLIEQIELKIKKYNLSKTNAEAYKLFREKYNNNPNPLDLYILVSYSYNYQIRFNNSMKFNNPFGKDRSSFSTNMKLNLERFIRRLNKMNATFTDKYFTDINFNNLNENDFVYLDPPYLITTGSYNDGNRGFVNWTEKQELEMYAIMEELTKKNIKWALSNVMHNKGNTHELLNDFILNNNVMVNNIKHNYNNASYNSKKSGSQEVLVTNYDVDTFNLLH